MKKSGITFITMLALLIAGIISNNAFAQEEHCGKGNMPGMHKGDKGIGFIKDLTTDQQKQIDVLKLNLIKETIGIKNQIEEKKAHIKTISTGDNVDMIPVNKALDELFALKAEIAKKHEAFQQDVRKILTAEQKVMFDIHKSERKGHGRMSEMGDGGMPCNMSEKRGDCPMGGMNGGCCKEKMGNGCGKGMMGNGGCKDMMGDGCCKEKMGKGCCKERMGNGACKGMGMSGEDNVPMKGCQGHEMMDKRTKESPK
jgi:Spy/CpxP family protein refolding chaperone